MTCDFKTPKVSVIIPVYNVEKYIHRCIDSVLNQTYSNLEIILIDDGSPDNCPKICDEYAKKDSRIKVIHKENGGLGYARNSGLEIANGEYITFVDSDDFLPPNAFEILVSNIDDADICGGEHITFKKSIPKYKNTGKCEVLEIQDVFRNIFNFKLPYNYQWAKLYKKELFDNVRYSNLYYEDVEINYRLLSQCKKVIVCHDVVYFYNIGNSSSITASSFNEKHFDKLSAATQLTENIAKDFPDINAVCKKYLCNANLEILKKLIKGKCYQNFPKQYLQIKKCFYENKKYLFVDVSFPKKIKQLIKIFLYELFFLSNRKLKEEK